LLVDTHGNQCGHCSRLGVRVQNVMG
jgi:xanthine dehydrogenase iron-sulfur cluster and FAD-binding subunit A